MKNEQIHVITKYFYPVIGGIETNILETYSFLEKMGWNVVVHTSKNTREQKNILKDTDKIKGIKINRYHSGLFGFFPSIEFKKIDLLCLHNFDLFPHQIILIYVLLLKIIKRKNFSLILIPHGGFNPEWSTLPPLVSAIKWLYHNTFGQIIINAAVDKIRAVSDWEKTQLIKSHIKPSLITVIENGIEKEAYLDIDSLASNKIKAQAKNYGKYILQVGRINKIKNYESTIRALVNIPEDINFVIVGPADYLGEKKTYKQDLFDLSKSLGVEKRVIFAGVINGIDKYYIIKHAQMMVHMALHESFCNSVHEGLSQRLICIVSNRTNLPYLVKNGINGYCLEPFDTKKLAETINYVLKNKKSKKFEQMIKENEVYGRKNSWFQISEKISALYSSLF